MPIISKTAAGEVYGFACRPRTQHSRPTFPYICLGNRSHVRCTRIGREL